MPTVSRVSLVSGFERVVVAHDFFDHVDGLLLAEDDYAEDVFEEFQDLFVLGLIGIVPHERGRYLVLIQFINGKAQLDEDLIGGLEG